MIQYSKIKKKNPLEKGRSQEFEDFLPEKLMYKPTKMHIIHSSNEKMCERALKTPKHFIPKVALFKMILFYPPPIQKT